MRRQKTPGQPKRRTRRSVRSLALRTASRQEARQIHTLIAAHLREGHLLPRDLSELTVHADRFIVAVEGDGEIVAFGELAPLSHTLAEIRSLVVSERRRGSGIGRRVVNELRHRAQLEGFETLCAFTHQPAYFVRMGFSIVPHTWLPEKISADCRICPLFRQCGQFAMLADLEPARDARASMLSLHA